MQRNTLLSSRAVTWLYKKPAKFATVLMLVFIFVFGGLPFGPFAVPYVLAAEDVFSTPGYALWTVPAGVSSADVACWGGGGGGGDGNASGGGGGGGGAFASSTISSLVAGTSYTLFIGAIGTGASAAASAKGGDGGSSTFATTTVVAAGGIGGAGGAGDSAGGAGGLVANSTGTVRNPGGTGGIGVNGGDRGGGGGGAAGPHGLGADGSGQTGGQGDNGNGGAEGVSNVLGGGGGGGGANGGAGTAGGTPGAGGGGGEEGGANGGAGKCTVTYTVVNAPSVTNTSATLITASTATIGGNITNTGGANATARGFASSTDSTFVTNVSTSSASGSFGTGTFTGTMGGLNPNTTYYFRAFATNPTGTGYGTSTSFLTLPATPGTPTYLNTLATTTGITWSAPSGGATSYKLQQCVTGSATCSLYTGISGNSTTTYGLSPNTSYDYAVRATNATGDGAWSATSTVVTTYATTTLANATDPSNQTIAPGENRVAADAFSFTAGAGTTSVSAVTLALGTSVYHGISRIDITDATASTTYGSISDPTSDTPTITLAQNIIATTTAGIYRIYITPKSHANMPAVPGSSYSVQARVTSFTASGGTAGSDTAGTTITIDNTSPADVTSATASAGNAQVDLAWSNPADSDFAETVILRSTSAIATSTFDGTEYEASGSFSDLSITTVGNPAVARMSSTSVAFIDSTNDQLRAYAFDGTSWSLTGSGKSISLVGTPALTALNSTDVALIDNTNDKLAVYRFNGSTWSEVGASTTVASIGPPSLAALNSTDVAFVDDTRQKLAVYRFNGSVWSEVGASTTIATMADPAIAALGTSTVALVGFDGGLRTYGWNGSGWTQIGNTLSLDFLVDTPEITALSTTTVVVGDYNGANDSGLRVYRFDGTDWMETGNHLNISNMNNIGVGVAALNATDIAFIDVTNDSLRTYRFDSVNWSQNKNVVGDATVVYAGTGTSFSDTGLDNGTPYYYKIFARDAYGNYSAGVVPTGSPVTPSATVTLANSSDPSNQTIAPGDNRVAADAFSFVVNSGTASVSSVTLELGTNVYHSISRIDITDSTASTTYGSISDPSSDTPTITLAQNIIATSTASIYRIYITPKSHANMPAVPGSAYSVQARVTSFTSTADSNVGSDTAGTTITIDNASPADVTSATASAGNAQVDLSWSNPADSDFAETVILRSTSAIATSTFEGTEYEATGSFGDLGINTVGTPALARLSSTTLAFIDGTNDRLSTYIFDGTSWSLAAASTSISTVGSAALAALNTTDVAFVDNTNDQLRTYRWSGSSWSLVGSGASLPSFTTRPSLTALTSTDVAYIDGTNDKLAVYRFNGLTWSEVGASTTISTVGVPALSAISSTSVAFADDFNTSLRTYNFNGTSWSQVGNSRNVTSFAGSVTTLSSTTVLLAHENTGEFDTFQFNGIDWTLVTETSVFFGTPAIAALNATDVAYIDSTNDQLRTYRFDSVNWSQNKNVVGDATVVYAGTGTSFSDTGLDNGTPYHYKIFARDAYGNYSAGVVPTGSPVTPVPGEPTVVTDPESSVAATAATLNGSISSTGGSNATARGFATSTNSTLSTNVSTSTESGSFGTGSFATTSTGLTGNSTYYYRAFATNDAGTSFGDIESFLTLPDVPSTPSASSVATSTAVISWDAPSGGAASYKLELCDGSIVCSLFTNISGVSTSTYGLEGNGWYTFAVRGTNATGDGLWSATSSMITLPNVPGTPTYSSIASTSLVVSWSTPSGGSPTYRVERCVSGTSTCVLATGFASSPQTITGLDPTTSYDFAVQAENGTGVSLWSATSTQVTASSSPSVITSAVSSITATSSALNGDVTATGGTTVTARGFATSTSANLTTSVATSTESGSFGTGVFSAASTGLAGNTTYYVRAFATNATGTGYGAIVSFLTTPDVPGNPSVSNVAATSTTVSWAAPTGGVATYKLEYCINGTSTCTLTTGISGTSASASALIGNSTYGFAVRGTNATGDGLWSATTTQLTLPDIPGTPTFSDALTTSVTVQWSAAAGGAASYKLERCEGVACSDFAEIATGIEAVSYGDSGLTIGTTYRYRVRGVNATGDGLYSEDASVTMNGGVVRGGAGAGGSDVGGGPPEGAGAQGGGGSGGGESIGNDPGFFAPTSNGASSGYAGGWTNAQNAYASDDTNATAASVLASDFSGFGFSIPGSDVVAGIAVRIEASGSTAAGSIAIELSWNTGTATTTTAYTTGTLSMSDAVYTLGGASNTWGRSWSASELSDANFRVRIVGVPSGNTVRIDALQVNVYHQASGGGGGGGGDI